MSHSAYVANPIVGNLLVQATATRIVPGQTYSVIGTSTLTNNAFQLPPSFSYINTNGTVNEQNTLVKPGEKYTIFNQGADLAQIFPSYNVVAVAGSGGSINAGTANTSYLLPIDSSVEFISLGADNWITNPFIINNQLDQVNTVVATGNLSTSMSGGIIMCNANAGAVILSLPAPSVGLNYRFICIDHTNAFTIQTNASANIVDGYLLGDATIVLCTAKHNVVFTSANALLGDSVDYVCDGTNWYVRGFGQTAGAFTVA